MRSSRISKDTAKLFQRQASPSGGTGTGAGAVRRITRSLARFAAPQNGPRTPDMEDWASPPAKKRRRRRSSDSPAGAAVKAEPPEQSPVGAPCSPPRPPRARKPAARTARPPAGGAAVSPPPGWEATYNAVKRMRAPGGAAHGAAVDTMGCERLADRDASPRDQRFHTLIALMLSSQTKDTVNAAAMHRLKTELPAHRAGAPAGLNLENVLAVDADLLNGLIWAVGFHNNKTKYIKQAAVRLRDEWNGDIPDTVAGLTSLPGVGPKMAYLCLSAAWGRTEGIGVDVHVHRITNLWGWNTTRNPEDTRLALQSWLPRDKWREINWLLVGFGQTVCLPVGRRCGDCDLGVGGLCKAAERSKVAGRKRTTREVLKKEEEEEEHTSPAMEEEKPV
ncbi:uncharacterized protein UV8b_00365 [Ustilaginoidea virens]|uniref:Endonuclease III homolog n=2 Tax=Ustilaginoidea virens TaxID=1159556 RepID=A0A8E5HJK2_USTVR|nr:uncharacterized protein UV8b_00365 [Ustilaginoidea virens]QUC16124.1 hypothetical protein UV8b_00365 [Ustilaginoidea virens]